MVTTNGQWYKNHDALLEQWGMPMRAVRVVRNGRPSEVIEVQDIPVPDVEPGGVRITVAAAALNFGDIARCRGGVASVMAQPPFTLGMEVCGVVEAAGAGAEEWLGRRVVAMCAMSFGGMADVALAPATGVFDAPPELDDIEAAAFLLPFHTTYLALHTRARLQAGETLLVVGGASALGTAAIQLGVAAGAHVITIAGGPEKGQLCEKLGAERAIDHLSEDVFDAVMAHTGERGAEVVCDLVGGPGTETIWTCVAYEGRYVPVGFNDDPESGLTGRPLRKVSMGNFSVVGVLLSYMPASLPMRRFGVVPNPPERAAQVHAALRALVADGAIRPVIGRRISLGQVAEALEDHEQRRTSGRTVVDLTLPT
jgi:NADPH2:quinone reductase